jgi:hypothetical protein
MTTQPTDEDILIETARAERGKHRSGASMAAMLGIAVVLGAAGGLLVFLPSMVRMLLPGPLALLGSFSFAALFIVGIVALLIAGFFLLAAFASSPLASWGSAAAGNCPSCGEARLRSDTVPGVASGAPKGGPRGIVTLCENCDYATASVTRPSGAPAA